MKFLKAVVGVTFLVMFILVTGTSFAAEKCPLCGMSIAGNENTTFVVTMKNGEEVMYCCPHCGLWVMSEDKDKVKSAQVRDFISGEWIDATKAEYLSGSKAVPACAPSWIAFRSKKEAEMFQKGFGGTLFGYADALKERAKQPKAMQMKMH